jgi:hypothetical protein
MTESVLTRTIIIVTEQKIILQNAQNVSRSHSERLQAYIQRSKAVPAEYMLASLAHHLSTAIVTFNWHKAKGTALNVGICSTLERNPVKRTPQFKMYQPKVNASPFFFFAPQLHIFITGYISMPFCLTHSTKLQTTLKSTQI